MIPARRTRDPITPWEGHHSCFTTPLSSSVIAIVAAIFGFQRARRRGGGIAKGLFIVFLILTVVSFVIGRSPP